VNHQDNNRASHEVIGDTTSAFRADFRGELDAAAAEAAVWGVDIERLPGGAALVVKRGSNAGSRFLLDQPTTSAGRQPGSPAATSSSMTSQSADATPSSGLRTMNSK